MTEQKIPQDILDKINTHFKNLFGQYPDLGSIRAAYNIGATALYQHLKPLLDEKDDNILLEALKEIRDYEGRATSMQRIASAAIQKYSLNLHESNQDKFKKLLDAKDEEIKLIKHNYGVLFTHTTEDYKTIQELKSQLSKKDEEIKYWQKERHEGYNL